MTQQNAAMAEQAMAAGQTLAREAGLLSQLVAEFQVRQHASARQQVAVERAA
jgi:hypothetical protein